MITAKEALARYAIITDRDKETLRHIDLHIRSVCEKYTYITGYHPDDITPAVRKHLQDIGYTISEDIKVDIYPGRSSIKIEW